ncbi:MAG: hypothetical protein A3F04_01560 [Candidatus Chisholmbacteria bacterium RIFCSPHIGHO2_12_FULL_49_9]|uniref:Uncharacterized protein n=1 Tax=Candidatus Chisholmbacteria bacterium RIFCSPHIGHO2_01_FULL_52_32 TaxID=1797591 RepID=A0A1G1VSR0_9BACT|nr:MAG: hypothetical protein A2786_02570 [Candidatus Chisholmbacteria bacterium RIFCSPHIGHO2_01_FULL_52_32]OGY20265.1 MAG: hypothetical protein A2900_04175 [Candidatus Chisholmbacteria bacterium RIFCSPLOWO2_01_FULL_50_28]OGY20895.1 MAG: hypothetical protein A3F04_01560 [Candidatus Chisholmbacteria bacterium RIFCSPHIGHO2_12_FULL_49_9]
MGSSESQPRAVSYENKSARLLLSGPSLDAELVHLDPSVEIVPTGEAFMGFRPVRVELKGIIMTLFEVTP